MRKSTVSWAEAVTVSAICFGLFIVLSVQAVLAGFPVARFSDAGNGWSIGLELVLTFTAMLYLHARGFDVPSLYPAPSLAGTLVGLATFAAAWLIGLLLVSPWYSAAQPQVTEFSYRASSMAWVIPFAMVNGALEEVFLLGVLVRGLRGYGLSIAVGLPLLVRVSYHLYQGPIGVMWVLVFGLTFTLAYIRSGQLWPPVLAHVLWDIVPFALHRS